MLNEDGSYKPDSFDFKFNSIKRFNKETGEFEEAYFESNIRSSVQKFPNGNVLISVGNPGDLIEIDPNGYEVWRFISPYENIGNLFVPKGDDTKLGPNDEASNCRGFPCNNIFVTQRYSYFYEGLGEILKRANLIEGGYTVGYKQGYEDAYRQGLRHGKKRGCWDKYERRGDSHYGRDRSHK